MHTQLVSPLRNRLRDRRVMIVEDEMLVAMLLEDELLEAGAAVLGPDGEIEAALRRVAEAAPGAIEVAVVDLNLHGRAATPVIEALVARGVPVVITTGYATERVAAAPDAPVLCKPFDGVRLVEVLSEVLRGG